MESAQKKQEYKYTEARIKANQKYANSKWRPNVFISKDKQEAIETRIVELGYKSFNEYINALIDADMMHKDVGQV